MKAAIYVRVSTMYQADKDSLPMQKKDLIAYAGLVLGIEEYEIFEDAGYSGKNTDRPAFQRMMSRIRQNEFTHLLVWKIDRISRNLLDFSQMYQELRKLRVTFVSKNEQFDTSTAIGEAMLKIILVFAELERNMTSERVTATMLSRAAAGVWNGGRVPYGYIWKDGSFTVDKDEASVCRMIAEDYIENKSIVNTVKMLNQLGLKSRGGVEWSVPSVYRILSSPFYAGTYRYNVHKEDGKTFSKKPEDEWILIPDHHPAIFTADEYNQIQDIKNKNKRTIRKIGQNHKSKMVHVFSGLLFCGVCGSKMTSSPGRTTASGHRTSNYLCPIRRKSKECGNQTISDVVVGEFLINYILNVLNARKNISEIGSAEELQKRLLRGSTFSEIERIDPDGLSALYDLLENYNPRRPRTIPTGRVKKKNAERSARKEKERQEHALERLNNIYVYGNMPEKEYLQKRAEITSRIEAINDELGLQDADESISDAEFVRLASHLLLSEYLKNREYIYYRNLALQVSPDVLQEYMTAILDSVYVTDGKVSSVTFRNGITNKFFYKKGTE